MRPIILLSFLCLANVAQAQTAREYFNELKAANAFNRYSDEYVCFRDDDVPSFVVIARGSSIIEHMKKAKGNSICPCRRQSQIMKSSS
jgi:hypothetical protein